MFNIIIFLQTLYNSIGFEISAASHHRTIGGLTVLVGAETSQSLIVHKDAEGITASHQHINAQVKLESIYYKWLWKEI